MLLNKGRLITESSFIFWLCFRMLDAMKSPILCTAETHFSCAHFYEQPSWTPERNRQEFGKCYSKYGHGHDYRLQVRAECDLDQLAETQSRLKNQLQLIREELDHKHLNFDVGYFSASSGTGAIPTCENIASYLKLRFKQNGFTDWTEIKLFEAPEIFVVLRP